MVTKWKQPGLLKAAIPQVAEKAPVTGAKNGMKLQDLRGLAFDAPQWEQLLDQLTFYDMVSLVADGGLYLPAVETVNAPGCRVDSGRMKMEAPIAGIALATTWNSDLAYAQGKLSGNWYLDHEIYIVSADRAGLCSTGDVCVSEALVSAQTAGMGEKGIAVANINPIAPAFGSMQEDLTQVSICSDIYYLPAVLELFQKETDPAALWALRDACHRNLYALVNSAAINFVGENTVVATKMPAVVPALMISAVVCWVLFVVFVVFWGKGKEKWKNTQEYLDFKLLRK